jgi:hypothetical protein
VGPRTSGARASNSPTKHRAHRGCAKICRFLAAEVRRGARQYKETAILLQDVTLHTKPTSAGSVCRDRSTTTKRYSLSTAQMHCTHKQSSKFTNWHSPGCKSSLRYSALGRPLFLRPCGRGGSEPPQMHLQLQQGSSTSLSRSKHVPCAGKGAAHWMRRCRGRGRVPRDG